MTKRIDFGFDIVNFLRLDGDVPRVTSYQCIGFARANSDVNNQKKKAFNC